MSVISKIIEALGRFDVVAEDKATCLVAELPRYYARECALRWETIAIRVVGGPEMFGSLPYEWRTDLGRGRTPEGECASLEEFALAVAKKLHAQIIARGAVVVRTHYDSRLGNHSYTRWTERHWSRIWLPDGSRIEGVVRGDNLALLGYPLEGAELRGTPKGLGVGSHTWVLRAANGAVLSRGATEQQCHRDALEVPAMFQPTRVEQDPERVAAEQARFVADRAERARQRGLHNADDLTVLRGVNPAVERHLNEEGDIWTLRQFAELEPGSERAREVGEAAGLPSRVDGWIAQARELVAANA